MNNYTYEAGVDEALHPDKRINNRMGEIDVSECKYGCKVYGDPESNLLVLGHSSAYGCTRTLNDIQTGMPLDTEIEWPDSAIADRRRPGWDV